MYPGELEDSGKMSMLETVLKNPWVRALGALLVLLVVAGGVYLLVPVLTSLFFSFLVAYILTPVVDFGTRLRIPRMVTISILLIALVAGAVILPVFLLANIVEEAGVLVQQAGEGISEERFDRLLDKLPLHDLVLYLGWAPEGEADFNERAVLLERLGAIIEENALNLLREYGQNIADVGREAGRSAAQILTSLGRWLVTGISFLVNLSLFGFVAIYLLRDYDTFMNGLRDLVPPRHRPRVDGFMHKIDLQLRSLLRGQLTVCLALAVLYGIGLHLAGTPFALPIALFGGAASIIPYIGPFLTLTPAVLFTVLFHGLGGNLVWVFAVFVAVQIIESYFLTPRVLGSHIGLNPVWVVVALMVFSTAFGFLGMVIAVPTAAVLKVVAAESYAYYRQSRFYREPLPAFPPGPSDGNSPSSSNPTSSSGASGMNA